jgi:predicted AAA+ superfamily ATPase
MIKRYIKRDIEAIFETAVRQFPSVIVTGPRQSGKTTLLQHLFGMSHNYVTMDNPSIRLMATREPELFFENHKPPLIIDEIQYTPQLFSYIKILIDKQRTKNGQFLLTGSQLFPLMAKASDSLAGRIATLTLLPLSIREQFPANTALSIDLIKKIGLNGGFPEIAVKKDLNLELWFMSYLQTYLERDVRQLRQIGDLGDFQKFLELMAAFNGQVLNLSSISRDLGVAVNTVKAWISIVEASNQVISIKPFYLNKGKRLIKSPKVYFMDSGLLCYLSGISHTQQVFKGPLSGQLFETIVLSEVIKSFWNKGKIPKIFWWRTSYGEEVDFIIEDKNRIIPVEVKLSSKANTEMVKGLKTFCKLFSDKIDKAFLVNLSGERVILDKKITAIPFSEFVNQL